MRDGFERKALQSLIEDAGYDFGLLVSETEIKVEAGPNEFAFIADLLISANKDDYGQAVRTDCIRTMKVELINGIKIVTFTTP